MPGTVLEDVASQHRLYLAAKPFHVGVNVDGIACPLHHPMVCSRQMRGHGLLSSATLSRCGAVADGAFLGDAKAPSLDIRCRVNRLGTCVTKSLHGVDCVYHGMPITCQSHHDVYVCIPDRATASGGDGMSCST
jgi:hypothetical protein